MKFLDKIIWKLCRIKNPENFEDIESTIVPSCDGIESIERAKTAIDFVNKYNLPKKGVISGLGPDTTIALGYDKNPGKEKLVFHKGLYDYMMNKTDWMIGIDHRSLNSIENILEVFPKGMTGIHALVSYPLQLKRFQKIIEDAKNSDKISKDINVIYVPTKQRPKWLLYELGANLKYHFKGKQKYFGK